MDYKGYECPICGKSFTEEDEGNIVVCPECGAPHHRECYTAHGECGCADKHGTDEAWDKQKENHEGTVPCPFCGKRINSDAVFCSFCGRSVSQYTSTGFDGYNTTQGQPIYGNPQQGPYGQQGPFGQQGPYGARSPYDPLGGIDPNEDFEGASATNLAKIIRSNPRKYLMIFSRIKNQGRSRFSFPALIFGFGWLLYRKQTKPGIILGILSVLLYIGRLSTTQLYATPILNTLYEKCGITSSTEMSMAMWNKVASTLMAQDGLTIFLFFLPMIFMAGLIAIHIIIAINGCRWYYKHCIDTVNNIESTCSIQEERDSAYRVKGGVVPMVIFAYMASYMITSYLPSFLG